MSMLRIVSYVAVALAVIGVAKNMVNFNILLAIFAFYVAARAVEYLTVLSFILMEKTEKKISTLIKHVARR